MKIEELFRALIEADDIKSVEKFLKEFEDGHAEEVKWVAVGNRENNSGVINVATDPGRSLVERLTNAVDGILEREHEKHSGKPDCRTPREAANAWLGVPPDGLATLTPRQRQTFANDITISITEGEKKKEARTVQVRDGGIGITPERMPDTILSLNASNKWTKHYLAGTFGQGGSSTFATSKYSLIASRYADHAVIGFTIVKYQDLPADQFKTGHYVYLTLNEALLPCEIPVDEFSRGTLVKHFGYDLNSYPSPLGPNSIYGLLNQTLFDPILPIWLEDKVHNYRRVIKGSCNALRGAVDEGDERTRGPRLDHHVPQFFVELSEFGRIGIEYWVLESATKENKRPSAAFVNPAKPIILTLNGQNQEEMTSLLIRKDSELPYLALRLICHIDCDNLSPEGKRNIFSSTREGARRGLVYALIQKEIINNFRSDDELRRLNEEAKKRGTEEVDKTALQSMRKEIARLLRLQGLNVGDGGMEAGQDPGRGGPKPPRPKPVVVPIPVQDPPTYIKFVNEDDVTLYPEQRKYIRIETDAPSHYHDPKKKSSINVIIDGKEVVTRGTTALQGGRMRIIVEADAKAEVGIEGTIRIELTRSGLPTLSDECKYKIVPTPPPKPGQGSLTLPPFRFVQIDGPDDERWINLDWPSDVGTIAYTSDMEDGEMVIYYSTAFPRFASTRSSFEAKDTAMAKSYVERYQIWLAVHSFLMNNDEEQNEKDSDVEMTDEALAIADVRKREERCRVATLSSLFASREVVQQMTLPTGDEAE